MTDAIPLYGRAALEAALQQAAQTPTRRRPTQQELRAAAREEKPELPTDNELYALFISEAYQGFKKVLAVQREHWLRKLQDPTLTVEEIRLAQGALCMLRWVESEEARCRTVATKVPESLPEGFPDLTAAAASEAADRRAP